MELEVAKSPWSRRMFMGSGLAVGAGSAAAVLAPADLFGTSTVYTQPRDLVLDEILRQLEGAVLSLQGRPNGEAARRIAGSLRMLASWGTERKVDDEVRRHLRDAVRRHGRGAIVARPFDAIEELKVRGYKIPPGAVARASPADHDAALDHLLSNGITTQWAQLAKKFEAGAAALDKRFSFVSYQDQDDDKDEEDCEGMEYMELLLQSTVFFFCTVMAGLLWEACVIVSLEYLGWQAYMWWEGC
jgi:hypothetical protein